MLTQNISIKTVIARIIRNTRVLDTTYIEDMNEWIPEAMGYMRTKQELRLNYRDVPIHFHKGQLPCSLIVLLGVEYKGQRLKLGNTIKHYQTGHNIAQAMPINGLNSTVFISNIYVQDQTPYTGPGNYIWKSDLKASYDAFSGCDIHPTHYYQIEAGFINTSIMDGTIRLYFLEQPVDEDDLPLIPDNENYKEALYWYVRAKMIGCGYKDTVYDEQTCMDRFEKHAARALGEIRYPTLDEKEKQVETQVRFIPPPNYWENFFRVDSTEPTYNNF